MLYVCREVGKEEVIVGNEEVLTCAFHVILLTRASRVLLQGRVKRSEKSLYVTDNFNINQYLLEYSLFLCFDPHVEKYIILYLYSVG